MTKREFINWLEKYPSSDDSVIEIFEPDAAEWLPVTGMVYDSTIPSIRLYGDEF